MEDLRDNGREESKFNKSQDDLHRLGELQNMAATVSCNDTWDSYRMWRNVIEAIEREIIPYLDSKQRLELNRLRVRSLPDYRSARLIGNTPPSILRENLLNWEIKLREFIVLKGMGVVTEVKEQRFDSKFYR